MRLWTTDLPTVGEGKIFQELHIDQIDDGKVKNIDADLELAIFSLSTEGPPKTFKLTATVSFTAFGECARCMAAAEQRVDTEFETLVDMTARTTTAIDLETPPEEGGFTKIEDGRIDLSEELKQRIYLAVPPLMYCKSDCKGLCLQCGADLNKDLCSCKPKSKSGKFDALASLLE
ncbi:MAG: DUF177 domain-containing protein [Candidatus Lindowbacteria bacterium]|nr:DUF177 domain-containing protein [Candidatus Lindowbacteria bacterium]